MKKKLFILLASLTFTVACNDEVEPNDVTFQVENGEVKPVGMKKIPATTFAEQICGYGWLCTEAHIINEDGCVESQNFYDGLVGMNPPMYYFDNQELTEFIWMDAIPADGYRTMGYQYDEETNTVNIANGSTLTILSCNGEKGTMKALSRPTRSYMVQHFRRMSEQELENKRKAINP